jgi:hypothetical protein
VTKKEFTRVIDLLQDNDSDLLELIDLLDFRVNDRHLISLQHFLIESFSTERLITLCIVHQPSARDSIPFPSPIFASVFAINLYQSALDAPFSRASRLMPRNVSDWEIQMFFLSARLATIATELVKPLRPLQFADDQQQLTRVHLKKCNFGVLLTHVEISLDAMGFGDRFVKDSSTRPDDG